MLRFFSDKKSQETIKRLANADNLSVFVGAGASKEVGFPTWAELVQRLAAKATNKKNLKHADQVAVRDFIASSGLLAAAERISAVLPPEAIREEIRSAIYGTDDPGSLIPGPLVQAVAELKVARDSTRVITTNYDQLLLQALRDAGANEAHSYCVATTRPQAVIHLHGVIGFAKPRDGQNHVVLTERDFLAPKAGGWIRDVVIRALEDGPCLFVGASLTDLNLLTPLYNVKSKHRHVVLFTRIQDQSDAATRQMEKIDSARWKQLGVEVLYADNYADSAVFVRELCRAQREPDGPALVDLLQEWKASVIDPFVPPDAGTYEATQKVLASRLAALLDAIQEAHGLRDEVMQLGLFALGIDDNREYAQILALSDRVMRDPRSSERLALARKTNWTGIKAICSAVPVSEPKRNYASRWKQMLAVPICLDTVSGACVGSIVLSSTAEGSRLCRIGESGLLTDEYAVLYRALEDAGRELLSPS